MYEANTVSKEILDALPTPKGFRMLVAMPEVKEKTAGGIMLPDDLKKREETASIIGQVLSMGDDCYADPARFPSGPWCKEGDWVLMRSSSGTRFKVKGREFRILNDDTIEAVVLDPKGFERA